MAQNILIVEDDSNINNLLKEALEKAGFTCEQAFSGTEAKLLIEIKSYALVLLDLKTVWTKKWMFCQTVQTTI